MVRRIVTTPPDDPDDPAIEPDLGQIVPPSEGRGPHLRRAAWWTLVLAALWAAALGWVWGWPMVIGIAAGAALGLANLWFAARALDGVVQRAGEHRPAPGRKWALPAVLLVKWPLILLALWGILWYLPARPEGVALGVAIALAAASIAAIKRSAPMAPPP